MILWCLSMCEPTLPPQSGRRSAGSSKSGKRSRKSSAKSVKSQGSESGSQKDKHREEQEGTLYKPTTTTTTTTALFSPQMLKIIIVYSRFTQLQNKEDHGHPKIAGASRVK